MAPLIQTLRRPRPRIIRSGRGGVAPLLCALSRELMGRGSGDVVQVRRLQESIVAELEELDSAPSPVLPGQDMQVCCAGADLVP